MPITILDYRSVSLQELRTHWVFTLARLRAEPQGKPFVKTFEDFGVKLQAVIQRSLELSDAETMAEAATYPADRGLDGLLDDVANVISGGKRPNVNSPLHQLYFGNELPSRFKRPVLGDQLARQSSWPQLLAQASNKDLAAMASRATQLVEAGQVAAETLQKASDAIEQFKAEGDHKKIFDQWNSIVASTHGALAAVVHENPDLRLDPNFADTFFMQANRGGKNQTERMLQERIATHTKQAASAQKALAELQSKKSAREQQKQAAAAAEAELTASKQAMADALKRQKAAEQALKTAKKNAKKK